MSNITTISLPQPMRVVVDEAVASGRYASISEFFRSLLRTWMEDKLVRELKESREELSSGYGKRLRSLKDLS